MAEAGRVEYLDQIDAMMRLLGSLWEVTPSGQARRLGPAPSLLSPDPDTPCSDLEAVRAVYERMDAAGLDEMRTAFELDLARHLRQPSNAERAYWIAFIRGRLDLIAGVARS